MKLPIMIKFIMEYGTVICSGAEEYNNFYLGYKSTFNLASAYGQPA